MKNNEVRYFSKTHDFHNHFRNSNSLIETDAVDKKMSFSNRVLMSIQTACLPRRVKFNLMQIHLQADEVVARSYQNAITLCQTG
jgi:hypothetical protein